MCSMTVHFLGYVLTHSPCGGHPIRNRLRVLYSWYSSYRAELLAHATLATEIR